MNYHCIWGKFSDDLLFIVILKFHFGTEKKNTLHFVLITKHCWILQTSRVIVSFMIPRPGRLRQEDCKLEASLRCVVKPYLTITQIMKEIVTVQNKNYLLRFLKKAEKTLIILMT